MVQMPFRRHLPLLAALLAVLAPVPAGAARHRRPAPPRLTALRCVPLDSPRCASRPAVPVGLQVILRGKGFFNGMRVTFRWSNGAIATTLRRSHIGWVVRVPARARIGTVRVYVTDRQHRRSGSQRLRVLEPRLTTPLPVTIPAGDAPAAFQGSGMWIWYLSQSEGGDVAAIAARAKEAGMSTVFVKSADGTHPWSQFTPELVSELHAQGLHVCGWQYLYGTYPVTEARAGAAAAAAGADCLVLDPETEYQGRYASAQRYMNELRAETGEGFAVGVASFPYVDYHPDEPYSVFMGPGGAQVNVPQTYWKTIGGGVTTVSTHTFVHNRIYGRPIAPLGQSYDKPPAGEIARFRSLWAAWGAPGISYWSWQSTADGTWPHLGGPLADSEPVEDPGWPLLARKARGDEVIWLQQHLASVDASVVIDGDFGTQTETALESFQTAHGIPATGTTDAATWQALLTLPVTPVDWTTQRRATGRARGVAADEFRGRKPQLGSSTSRTP
jgi:hypothetical protein